MKKQIHIIFLLFLFFCSYLSISYLFSRSFDQTKTAKIELGRFLFFDNRLSYNNTKSCSSCHDPQFAFTDGYRTSAGADGYNVKRNAPSLLNSRFNSTFTWGDSSIKTFVQQLQFPLYNEHPKELGWTSHEHEIIEKITSVPAYKMLFKKAFPNYIIPINAQNIVTAIASFEEQLVSFGSSYDLYLKGKKQALSPNAMKGMELFYSNQLGCGNCHQFTNHQNNYFYNTGLYNLNNTGDYPFIDQGLYFITKNNFDKGKFRVPSLRNVMLTAPYTHDGSVGTIEEMIDIYQRGGRNIVEGENKGDGKLNQYKSKFIKGFSINAEEKLSLIAFLSSLTDTSFKQNKQVQNPFN